MPEPPKSARTYELPDYARDFKNLPAAEQEHYYAKFELKSSVEQRLFNFLCQVIADAQKKTRRPATSYKYYTDIVLKWASNPNNLRSIQGFPRSEETLKNNLNPMLQTLVNKGVCRVIPSLDEPDEHKFIALQPEALFGSPAAEKELEGVVKKLEQEFTNAVDDPRHPLPTREQIEAGLKRPLNPALHLETIPPAQCNRAGLAESRLKEAHLIQIPLGQDNTLLLTPEMLARLPETAAERLIRAINELPSSAPLDTLLKEKFPSETTLSLKGLLETVGKEGLSGFSSHTTVWSTIAHFMMEEIKRTSKDNLDRQNKRLATFLTLTWLSHERGRELETGLEEEVLADLYNHIANHRRYMTPNELKNRPKAQNYLKRHDEDRFQTLFSRLIQEHSLSADPEKAIIRLTGSVIGICYIHARHILTILRSVPVKERDKIDLIAQRALVLPISENLYRENIPQEIQDWLADETKMEEQFKHYLIEKQPQLTALHSFMDIYAFFTDNVAAVSLLCTHYHFPEHAFLISGPGGSKLLRPLLAMLGISGEEVIRRARKRVPLLRKYLHALKGLFGKGAGSGRPPGTTTQKRRRQNAGQVRKPARATATSGRPSESRSRKPKTEKNKSRPQKTSAPGKMAGRRKPPGARTRSPKELFALAAKDKSADYYLGIWNRVLGPAAKENSRICDAIIKKKVAGIERRVKGGEAFVNLEEQASYIAYAPQLGQIEKKEALNRYVQLKLLEELEALRKGSGLRFEYISTDK